MKIDTKNNFFKEDQILEVPTFLKKTIFDEIDDQLQELKAEAHNQENSRKIMH